MMRGIHKCELDNINYPDVGSSKQQTRPSWQPCWVGAAAWCNADVRTTCGLTSAWLDISMKVGED
jgi:hypothetical protein